MRGRVCPLLATNAVREGRSLSETDVAKSLAELVRTRTIEMFVQDGHASPWFAIGLHFDDEQWKPIRVHSSDQGHLLAKKNSFTDFIDVTRYLVGKGYAAKGRVAAQGGSAGGLLMGGIMNMAPEDYSVVIAQVPFALTRFTPLGRFG